jgi:hypothetical protein
MGLSAKPKLLRRHDDSSDAAPSPSAATFGKALSEGTPLAQRHPPLGVNQQNGDDSLLRVIVELSHDLRQPLTSLNMNLQTAVKMLQLPTPQISGALEALVDCLGTDRDMVELITHAQRRATTLSTNGPVLLNDVARELLLSARNLEPNWRMRLSDRLATPSPVVMSGFLRLRLALLSLLRRSLILDEAEPGSPQGIFIETRSMDDDRAELRFTGLPASLPLSYSFQSLHMLITTLVRALPGHANLTVHEDRVSFVISAPIASTSTLHLTGARHGD